MCALNDFQHLHMADRLALLNCCLQGTIDEAEEIVTRARMWRWKPYGEVTLRMAQDAYGQPVETMQVGNRNTRGCVMVAVQECVMA